MAGTPSAAQADAFYGEVLSAGEVWGVRDADGFPALQNAEGRRAMPFWSKESRAARVVADVADYRGFTAVRIPLGEWRERWLPGLSRDGLLVGLNWSGLRAAGYDVPAAEVEAALAVREVGSAGAVSPPARRSS